MSTRAPLLAAASVTALLAGVTGVRLAYTLAYSLTLLLAVSWAWSWAVSRRVRVERESPAGSFSVGDPFSEQFTVSNGAPLPVAHCEIRDRTRLTGYAPGRACALGPGQSVTWTASGTFSQRGRHEFGPLTVRTGDPFGLFVRHLRVADRRTVLVHPALHAVPDISPVWGAGGGGDARTGRVQDVPPDAAWVREYHATDGLSRIHWPSTARTGRLMSRSYDTRNRSDLLVVLDLEAGHHVGHGPADSLEHAVSVAASICHASLRRGQAVALVTNDSAGTVFGAGRGETHRLRLLDFLAEVRDDGTVPVADVVTRHSRGWRGRGGLVVVTGSHDPAWVGALVDAGVSGQRHLVVLVDPAAFGAPGAPLRIRSAWRVALDWWVIGPGGLPGMAPAPLAVSR